MAMYRNHPRTNTTRRGRHDRSLRLRSILGAALLMLSLALIYLPLRASARKSEPAAESAGFRVPERLPLQVSYIQQGSVIEIKGKTSRGATVMVNGEELPSVLADGTFTYFLSPTTSDTYALTVTAQDQHGAVSTKHLDIPAR
jgi:hypothetical protein